MREQIVSAGERDQRLEKYIKRKLPEATTSFVYKMLRKKNITLNGKKADGKEIVATGDKVTFFLSDETYEKFAGNTNNRQNGFGDVTGSKATGNQKGASHNLNSTKPAGTRTLTAATGNVRSNQVGNPAQAGTSRAKEYLAAYSALTGRWKELRILVETSDLMLVNKPAGVLSQKAKDTDQSLNEWFVGYLLKSQKITEESMRAFTPSIANRLDRNTAGIVICAKTLLGSRVAAKLLREKSQESGKENAVAATAEHKQHAATSDANTQNQKRAQDSLHKYYQMIVKGRAPKQGVLEGWITKDPKANMVQVLDAPGADCSFARTEYKSLQYDGSRDLTLVEAELITGRTHQLRAQMQHMGHPILGDPKYGDNKLNERYKEKGVRSQLLACVRVEFPEMEEPEMAELSGRAVKAPAPSVFDRVLS